MSRRRFILKREALFTLLIGIFFLYGCGLSEGIKIDRDNLGAETIVNSIKKETGTTFTEDDYEDNESPENLLQSLKVGVSSKAEDINYYGEAFFVPPCISDGENIYFRQDSYFSKPGLYIMPVGSDELRLADIDIPEGMDIGNIAIDIYGRIHLLVTNRSNEKHFIWRLNESYQIDKTIDISEYAEESRKPWCFLINKDNTYYIQWQYQNQIGLIVDSEGALMHNFTAESLGTEWVSSVGVGKDGQFYLVHGSEDKLEIGKIDVKNGCIEKGNTDINFPGNESFFAISSGTDTNLLLYSPLSGVWAYDTENETIENRVPMSESSFGYYAEFNLRTFLPDGRLLLEVGIMKDNSTGSDAGENLESLLFKYIPAGK